jgi:hypothetical protein
LRIHSTLVSSPLQGVTTNCKPFIGVQISQLYYNTNPYWLLWRPAEATCAVVICLYYFVPQKMAVVAILTIKIHFPLELYLRRGRTQTETKALLSLFYNLFSYLYLINLLCSDSILRKDSRLLKAGLSLLKSYIGIVLFSSFSSYRHLKPFFSCRITDK